MPHKASRDQADPTGPKAGKSDFSDFSDVGPTGADGGAGAAEPVDPFSPENLRLGQDYVNELGVEKVLLRIPVRKPNRQEFIRVNPDPAYRFETAILELKDDREYYCVTPELRPALADEIVPVRLYLAVNRQETVFFWPGRLPGIDGRRNAWHESAHQLAELAMRHWVRVYADHSLGAYAGAKAAGDLGEPRWPKHSLRELLRIAFGSGYLIDSPDHPALRRLRGVA